MQGVPCELSHRPVHRRFCSPEQDVFVTVNAGRIGGGTLTEQDPGIIKERAQLYAHMPLIPVSNGDGFGTPPLICRENALWLDSIKSIKDTDLTGIWCVIARSSARLIVAPMPTEVIVSASLINCSIDLTRKG